MGGAVFSFCCLTWGQTMMEVMKIMAISFKKYHAHIAVLSAPDSATGHRWPTPLLETPGHSWASLDQSLVESVLPSPGSWCTQGFFFCPLQRSVSPILCKFWWIYGGVNGDLLKEGLCHTQVCCTQSPCSVAGHWWTDILQDGRIEGPVLIFSCENSKITTFCWTTIDKMLDPTKKRIPTFKGKGETTECQ